LVGDRKKREDAALRKPKAQRSTAEVLAVVAKVLGVKVTRLRERHRDSWLRAMAAWALLRHGGLNQRAAAAALGMGSGAAVSQQLAKWRARAARELSWRDLAAAIDCRLAKTS
jgi:hypothetical protein